MTGALPTRERQRAETRDLILRVALAEIAEAGLSQARIEHIARKAGVTRPTIYAHFPSKDDFLRALQARTEEETLDELQHRLGSASGADLVHGLADAIFDLLGSAHPVLRRETFSLVIREQQRTDWLGNVLSRFLSKRLEEAHDRGELRSSIPPGELTRLVVTALFGFLILEGEPAESRRRSAHVMLDLLIRGATGGPTTNPENPD